MSESHEARLCRAAGMQSGSVACHRLVSGIRELMHMREQARAESRVDRDAARRHFREALHVLRSAVGSATVWSALVETRQDEEIVGILGRLDTIEEGLGGDDGGPSNRRGDSYRSPRQAQLAFARLLVIGSRREQRSDGSSSIERLDLPRFLWLVDSLLRGEDAIAAEGSDEERAAITAFARTEDGAQLLSARDRGRMTEAEQSATTAQGTLSPAGADPRKQP